MLEQQRTLCGRSCAGEWSSSFGGKFTVMTRYAPIPGLPLGKSMTQRPVDERKKRPPYAPWIGIYAKYGAHLCSVVTCQLVRVVPTIGSHIHDRFILLCWMGVVWTNAGRK